MHVLTYINTVYEHFSVLLSVSEKMPLISFAIPLCPPASANLQGKGSGFCQKEMHPFHPNEISKTPQQERDGLKASETVREPAKNYMKSSRNEGSSR